MENIDVAIIGGGVIGLAVAEALADKNLNIFIFEKNVSFGQETSSRNSEVIHSGIYYPESSLKKRLCIEGNKMMYDICRKNGIAYKQTGKLIVAKDDSEIDALEALYNNGISNGLYDIRILSKEEAKNIEPNVISRGAIFLPMTGIVNSHALMEFFLNKAKSKGADILYKSMVTSISKRREGYILKIKDHICDTYDICSRIVINCAGLFSDMVACMVGISRSDYTLHYCKGDYFRVGNNKGKMLNGLVYPVVKPDDNGLGIHATIDLTGSVRLGPDAEYISGRDIDYSINLNKKSYFYESVREFLPFIEKDDLSPDTSGMRPKLQAEGTGFRDFVIQHEIDAGFKGFINLVGIESPGLTASPAIALMVKNIVEKL